MSQCDIQPTNYLRRKSAKKTYALDSNEDFDKSNASTTADEHEKNSNMRISQSPGDILGMDENENQIEDDDDDDDGDDDDDDADELENDDDDNDDSTQLSINHPHSTKRKKSNKKKGKRLNSSLSNKCLRLCKLNQ